METSAKEIEDCIHRLKSTPSNINEPGARSGAKQTEQEAKYGTEQEAHTLALVNGGSRPANGFLKPVNGSHKNIVSHLYHIRSYIRDP